MKKIFPILMIVIVLAAFAVTPVFAQDVTPPADGVGFDIDYISQLLQALILATIPVLAGAATKWVLEKARVEKAKLSQEQQWALELFVKTVVYAAEQMKIGGFVSDKLDYATWQVQSWLDRHGIKMDVSEIRAHIESAVLTEFNFGNALPDSDPEE